MIELRGYQNDAREQIREHIRAGRRRVMLCMPGGSGKTETAMAFVESSLAKDSHSLFLSDRVPLVHQHSQRFWNAGIPHGVIQGAQNTQRRWERAQIGCIQTIETREFWPQADLVIVDEAHRRRRSVRQFMQNTTAVVIGLSGTPFTDGLGTDYDALVNAVTTRELLKAGWLAPFDVYNARKQVDMRGARTKAGGEWADRAAEERGVEIIGDIVAEWVSKTHLHFGGPVKTLLFGPTVAFCRELCAAFQAAGYDFRTGSYKDDNDETQKLVEGFKAGHFVGLASVDKFATGFDVPSVMCVIFARPYRKSFTSHIQSLARLMRISEGKKRGLLLDFVGNYLAWRADMQDFFDYGCPSLSDINADINRTRQTVEKEAAEIACFACGFVVETHTEFCPACGAEWRQRRNIITSVPGQLELVGGVNQQAKPPPAAEPDRPRPGAWKENRPWVWKHVVRVASGRHSEDDDRARKFARVQFKNICGDWPDYRFERDDMLPDPRVEQAVTYRLKKYWQRGKPKAA